jgi:soluble lytic murein transglycosylase-like protein
MSRKLFICLLILMSGIFLYSEVYGKEGSRLLKVQPLAVPGAFFRSAMDSLSEIIIPPGLRTENPLETGIVSSRCEPGNQPEFAYSSIVVPLAAKHGVDWRLVAAVIQAESGFNPRALSSRGAVGLMQVMPTTAALYQVKASDLYNPKKNVEAGVRHLRMLSDRYNGDLVKVIAAYNSGEGNVDRYRGIPPYKQTRNFVRRVLNHYQSPAR